MNRDNIIFIDFEISIKTDKIEEVGLVYRGREYKTSSLEDVTNFMKLCNAKYLCGHNFVDFDMEMIRDTTLYNAFQSYSIIDTLPLSLLLFSEKTVHSLPKDYKGEDDFKNNPVEDSKLTSKLLIKLVDNFLSLDKDTQNIFYSLLKDQKYFDGFFLYMESLCSFELLKKDKLHKQIIAIHQKVIVNYYYLKKLIESSPIELSYILALLTPHIEIKSHPPRVLHTHTTIVEMQKKLCLDVNKIKDELGDIAKEIFGFGTFRPFPKLNPTLFGSQSISQKDIVEASLRDESFLTVLPTGGGKTFTFWLPAIIKSNAYKSLTVVISPLQALIEDHITSFNAKVANYRAVAISGYMSPLERSEAIDQVISGEADVLYLAPESLRSNAIFTILKNRYIERFVVDEAHCLSTWGNDFRQDYYYICDYIKDLLKAKSFQEHIPISCFTATAKPSVIEDIKVFFKEGLDIKLGEYIAIPERKNLYYKSIPSEKKNKYIELLRLINEHSGSTLVYIPSSTKDCDSVAKDLARDTDKRVNSFHSKIDSQEKMKILKDYILDDIDIIVATTAFGMGVDKANITNVIHYEMSDSLESYAQEAGRGARDQELDAFCPILYDEDDLDKHFSTLNRSKITASEINSIFQVLKKAKGDVVTKTAFEIALEAGWDVEDSANDYTTKVKTALLELEREEYISRQRNRVNFFADSIASNSIEKLRTQLDKSTFKEQEKEKLIRVLHSILGRGKVDAVQIDELAHLLGYQKADISLAIQQLKEMHILGNCKDLTLQIRKSSLKDFIFIQKIELDIYEYLQALQTKQISIKELNEYLHQSKRIQKNESELIKNLIRNWRDKSTFLLKRISRQNDLWYFEFLDAQSLRENLDKKQKIASKSLEIFSKELQSTEDTKDIDFSLKSLRDTIGGEFSIKETDKTLLYLHHLNIVELLNGRFISYSPMSIQKEEKIKIQNKKYTLLDYKNRLEKHYRIKTESIHIMGEYAQRLHSDDEKANIFMRDYFILPYDKFKRKYKLLKEKISRPITQRRYDKIFAQMSSTQQEIIKDQETKAMMILAGPGSGKTKVLVHKIASLVLTEDIKPEQFMMLTFSRTAAGEFKGRLNQLIGTLSYDIEINTFHSYALKLIARVVKENEDTLKYSIVEATKQINSGDITLPYKRVLVLDEFQDINQDSFELVKAIYSASNQEMRIIAVGDDDQCINGFTGANVKYIDEFKTKFGEDEEGNSLYKQYELLINYRSKQNIVDYSNDFISKVNNRYKLDRLEAHSKELGSVKVETLSSHNLIALAVEKVKAYDAYEDIAILAFSNDEVMQLYSGLEEAGVKANFIIKIDGFKLKNLIEVVEFDKTINTLLGYEPFYTKENFDEAIRSIQLIFKGSKNLNLLENIINKFLNENQIYYVSQWLAYLDEVTLEEFEYYKNSVTVSTIHKSKGMEFDKVILLQKNKKQQKENRDDEMRLYYVGMTRAKSELTILRQGSRHPQENEFATYKLNTNLYPENENTITLIMGLSDIYLGFKSYEKNHNELLAGSDVSIEKRYQYNQLHIIYKNHISARLSKSFQEKIDNYLNQNYTISSATIEYVVQWYDGDKNEYLKHPLCKIILKRGF